MQAKIAADLKAFQTTLVVEQGWGKVKTQGDLSKIARCLPSGVITGDAVCFGIKNRNIQLFDGVLLLTVVFFDRESIVGFIQKLETSFSPLRWTLVGDRGSLSQFFNEYFFTENIYGRLHIRILIMKNVLEFAEFLNKVECLSSQVFCDSRGKAYRPAPFDDIYVRVGLNQKAFDFPQISVDEWKRAVAGLTVENVQATARMWFDFFSSITRQALFNATLADFTPNFNSLRENHSVPVAMSPVVTGKHVWWSHGAVVATFEPLMEQLEHLSNPGSQAAVKMSRAEKIGNVTFELNGDFRIMLVEPRPQALEPLVLISGTGQMLSFGVEHLRQLAWLTSSENKPIQIDSRLRNNFESAGILPLNWQDAIHIMRGFLSGCYRAWRLTSDEIFPVKSAPPQNETAFEFIQKQDVFSELIYNQAVACEDEINFPLFLPAFPALRDHRWATRRVHEERPKVPAHAVTRDRIDELKAGTCESMLSPGEDVNVQDALSDPEDPTILITDGRKSACVPRNYFSAALTQTTSLRVKCTDRRTDDDGYEMNDFYAQEDMVVAQVVVFGGASDWVPVNDVKNCLRAAVDTFLLLKTTAEYNRTYSVNGVIDPSNSRGEHGGDGGASVKCQPDTRITISRLIPWFS